MPAHAQSSTLVDHTLRGSSLAAPARALVVGLAVAVTALSAQFTLPLPMTAVPFTLTPMAVLLVGAALGSRLGALSQMAYVLAGAAGLAVFSPSATLPPGMLRLLGPTGGYLLAYPLAAFVAGWLSERGWDRHYLSSAAAMLAGLAVIYAGGVTWLALVHTSSFGTAVLAGVAQFVVLDVMKIAAAAMILPLAWRFLGRSSAR